MAFLLFDIGGTKMRLALSEDGKAFSTPHIIPTPKDFAQAMGEIKMFTQGKRITAAAGGIAGVMDKKKGSLFRSPNLRSWEGKPFLKLLKEAIKADAFIENDADLAGLGEAVHGAGKSKRIVAYLTISTGVGGVRIVDKKIDANTMGFEPGHHILFAYNGNPCPCGGKGDLEAHISGSALEKRYGKKPEDIDDKTIWDEEARILAYALNNVSVFWSPEVIMLGGSLMEKISIEKVREYIKKVLTIFPAMPKIERATLGDLGGLYGALVLLKEQKGYKKK